MKENQRRHNMSEICHPDKITLGEFVADIRSSLKPFQINLSNLTDDGDERYIEEWFEVFARWTEIQSEGFDPFLPKEA